MVLHRKIFHLTLKKLYCRLFVLSECFNTWQAVESSKSVSVSLNAYTYIHILFWNICGDSFLVRQMGSLLISLTRRIRINTFHMMQMGPLLEKTAASFRLLPPTEEYVPPFKDPWRFW